MKLTAENVTEIFTDCLFRNGENTDNAKIVDGIMNNFGFHPDRIEKHKDDIYSMLKQLPEQFHSGKGEGWSFLNACNDKNGRQWAGLHKTIEQLFVIGIACNKVKCLLPKHMWSALYGGMPYYTVL